ncbi:hypothetical protein FIBSPDRAFT_399578 [Athelia psychrophila]|uniref:Uncharacterized protein n=1 Tax=Athelia psychrophila TaxID=1759441 RepID=A0A166NF59_9AGAM|nr:hypothetical protein FIBSPDRAFT_399578 [Fibularhizoctonia sp. CBS 109695]
MRFIPKRVRSHRRPCVRAHIRLPSQNLTYRIMLIIAPQIHTLHQHVLHPQQEALAHQRLVLHQRYWRSVPYLLSNHLENPSHCRSGRPALSI